MAHFYRRGFTVLVWPLLLLCSLATSAQQTTYRINYDIALFDLPAGLVQAPSGNFVFAGTNTSGIPISGTLTEVNNIGTAVWSKRYNSGIATDFQDIKAVSGGGYIVTGSNGSDLMLMRTDAAGNVTWSYSYQVSNTSSFGNRVLPTSDGGFVVAGGIDGADPDGAGPLVAQDSTNMYCVKVDANGALQWGNVFFATTAFVDDHALTDVAEVSDGYIFTGYVNESGNDGPTDAVILKTNFSGVRQWSNRFGGGNSQDASAIKRISGSEVLVTGGDNGRPYYIRVNGSGSVLAGSRYAFGFLSLDQAFGTDLVLTNDGNYAIFGTYVGFNLPPVFSSFLIKINPSNGSLIFQKYYSPTSTSFLSVSLLPEGLQAADSSYVLISTGFGSTGTSYDYELIKADKNGLLNNSDCPEANLNLSRSSYTPTQTSFTPLSITSVTRSSVGMFVTTPSTAQRTACLTIACNRPPAATSATITNNNFCPGVTTQINASGTGTNVTYNVFTSPSGGTSIGSTPLTVSPSTTTTYYVETSDNTNPLCVSASRTPVTVTVLPATPAQPGAISGPNPACPGNRTYTIGAVTNASSYNWSVSGGGSISGSGTSVTINWTTSGTYTISVTATNSCGTSAPRTLQVTVDNPPPAQPGAITGNTNPCPGSEGYTIAAVTNATSYNWSVSGGGSISGTGTSATVNWTTPGTYTISVTATNSCGTSTARTLQVNVQNGPPTTVGAISGQTNVCVGNQPYSVPAVAGATTYTWSLSGGGTITGNGNANVTINWTTAGTHSVSVTASNPCGSVNANPITVTVVGAPPATPGPITGTNDACTGNQTYSIPTVAGATGYNWSISGGGTVVSGATSTSFTVNWTTAGTHNVSVTATNACGTSSPATIPVTVNTTVPPTAGAITGQTSVCAGSQGYSIGAVSGATGYVWAVSGGGTITGNGTSATVNWTTPGGPYTITVTPTNACGNGTPNTLSVTVLTANPAAPASITGSTPVCIGTETYTAAAVVGASSYTWSVNGGGTIASGQGTASAGINWTTAGTWTVSVTATSICGVSQPTTLTVEVLPANPATPGAISGNSPACPGTEGYSIVAVSGATGYTWSVSGGGTVSSGQNTTAVDIDWTTAGTWTVSVTANSICGSSAPSTRTVTVLPANPGNAGVISGNINACPGSETYTIAALPDASGYTWTVSGGGTITGNGTSATVNWTTTGGPYTITVVPTNQCGNGGAATLDVNVLPQNPAAPASITGASPVCFGSETYTAAAVSGATGYTWSVSGGGTIGTNGNQTININWTTAGTHTVSVTAQNQCGSSTVTTYTVEVLPASPPTPGNITGPAGVCPDTVTYSIPTVPGASGYTWTVGTAGTIFSGQGTESIEVIWATVSGTYPVSVVAENQCGTSQASTIQVTITPGPPTGTPVISGNDFPCPGTQSYTLSGVTGASDYTWTVSGGGSITAGQGTGTVTINWTTTGGPYTIGVTPSNSCGNGTPSTFNVEVDGPPVIGAATISGNNNPCPASEAYTISPVTNATGYTWTVSGGGTITAGQGTGTVTINWTTSGGPYTISATADNACGSSASVIYSVTVQPGPPSAPTAISGPNSVCQGSGTANYSVGAVTNATGYTWSVSGGGSVTSGQGTTNATIDWTGTPGNYTVSVTATNNCGTSQATTYNVTIAPGPPAQPGNITGSASVCPGTEAYSIGAVANATGYTWTVSGGGTIASGQGTSSITVNWTTSGGPYLVSVVATNNCGNSLAQNINVTVQVSPTAPNIITSNDTICEGQSATITATGSTGGATITYNIYDNQTGGTLLGISPLAVTPTVTTTYYVEVINDLGCRNSGGRIPVTIVVLPAPAAPVISGSNLGVCYDESITLTATSTGNNLTWWNAATGGTLLGSGNNFTTGNLTSSTTFYVEATSANGCGSITGRVPVTVSVAQLPSVTLTTDAPNNSIYINQALIATCEPDDYSWYQWFLNGTSVQEDSINTWRSSILSDGDIISVIATDGGCVGEETEITITVSDFPNAFTPNGDGRNDVFLKGFDLVIINRWGQELYTGMDGWDGTFNGDPVSPGTYFYIVRVPDITNKDNVLKGSVLVHY